MQVRGLPIGRGEIWHDPVQRTVLLAVAAASLMPAAVLALAGTSVLRVELLLALCAVPAVFAALRWKHFAARLGVGLGVGLAVALAYMGAVAGLHLAPLPSVTGLVPAGAAWVAAWGVGYALLAGRARWYWGLAWGALLLAPVLAGTAWPHPLPTLGAWLALHLGCGAVLGWLNEVFQPEWRGRAKIVFLRDYTPGTRQPRRLTSRVKVPADPNHG